MALLSLCVAALALVGVGALIFIACRFTRRLEASLESPAPLVGRYVQLNTRRPDDQTLRGICLEQFRDGSIILGAAQYIEPGQPPLDAGEVYVRESNIAFIQRDVIGADGETRPPLPRAA